MADQHMANLDTILSYVAASPMSTCPVSLFAEIIRVNHLRHQLALANATPPHEVKVGQMLQRINSFDVEIWALQKSNEKNRQHWQLLGCVYKHAVALYCILSLESLTTASSLCDPFHVQYLSHQLSASIAEAVQLLPLKRLMFWPLVVMGVSACGSLDDNSMDEGGPNSMIRVFVSAQLVELSRHLGSFSPLVAKDMLEDFWRSGRTGWDNCFDRPHIFTSQIAVDTSMGQ